MPELVDIVNQADQVVDTVSRDLLGLTRADWRFVNLFIRDSRGRFWTPQRRQDLTLWPGGPDFAVGGAVSAGEDYVTAVIREAQEEIGWHLQPNDLREIAYLSPYKYPVAAFMKVYELVRDETPEIVPGEYSSAQWLNLDELIQILVANNVSTKPDLLPVLRLCYGPLRSLDRTQFAP